MVFGKILFTLASPLMACLSVCVCGLLWAWFRPASRKLGIGAGLIALAFLWAASTPFAAAALTRDLELKYPLRPAAEMPRADMAVVLGGALSAGLGPSQPPINMGSAIDRVFFAAELYRAGRVGRIVLSGGSDAKLRTPPEAELMRTLLIAQGVPGSALLLETRSRTTRENAAYSAEMLRDGKARTVLLVTSAFHMRRALGEFRRATAGSSIELIAAPCDIGLPEIEQTYVPGWLPDAQSLAATTRALKEYAGLAAAHIRKSQP